MCSFLVRINYISAGLAKCAVLIVSAGPALCAVLVDVVGAGLAIAIIFNAISFV